MLYNIADFFQPSKLAHTSARGLDLILLKSNLSFKKYPSIKKAAALYVRENDKQVSRYALLNEVEFLWKCNPSRENRKFQKLLSNIKIGNINEFDILSHLSTMLNHSDEETKDQRPLIRTYPSSQREVHLTYEQAKTLEEEERRAGHPLYASKSILEALDTLFKFIQTSRDEQSGNQEEGEREDDGGEVEEKNDPLYTKDKKFSSSAQFASAKDKLLKNFRKYMDYLDDLLSEEEGYEISIPDLCYFLVLYYQLIYVAGKSYQIDDAEYDDSAGKTLLPARGPIHEMGSFDSLSVRILGRFILLLSTFKPKKYDNDYAIREFDTYREQCAILIYFALAFHAHCNEKKSLHWWALLWMNTEHSLPPYRKDLMLKFLESVKLKTQLDIPADLYLTVEKIQTETVAIRKSAAQFPVKQEYIKLPDLGVTDF